MSETTNAQLLTHMNFTVHPKSVIVGMEIWQIRSVYGVQVDAVMTALPHGEIKFKESPRSKVFAGESLAVKGEQNKVIKLLRVAVLD